MDTNAFRVDIDITTWPYQSRLSSLNEVLIFLYGHVEKFLQDEATGTVISSLGSEPDPSFRDHRHSLNFENFRPDYVFQLLRKELRNRVLSRLISDRILATCQRTDLPKGRPLFMMVNVELTRKEYLAAPSVEESVVEEPHDLETEETCAICLEDISTESKYTKLPCDHPFHEDCITKWIDQKHNSCPLCRQAVEKTS